MASGSWLSGSGESSLLHAYLESSGGASATTGLSIHSNGNRKACSHSDTVHKVCSGESTRAADMVRTFAGSLCALCASVLSKTRSYFKDPWGLQQAASSNTVTVEDHQLQRRSSSHCQRRRHPQQQQQRRRDAEVGAAKVPTCCDYSVRRKWCWTAWMPALCASVVGALCYVNSLDGDFVHDDMVAVVGNLDVNGDSRRHASSSSSSLWINDFWGRPMADPRRHKSYRPLTVLTGQSRQPGGLAERFPFHTSDGRGKIPGKCEARVLFFSHQLSAWHRAWEMRKATEDFVECGAQILE
ncbi:hypothetical protein HPB52_009904 [Rhipicephalus sanguineus]|uniref:Uncharacterized protein n=1 Tax=Rhipicephalus sanguineus TaxID=34632 RepID=A0A9D4PB86_RHISA|nr:hypothetical protein HPB52_009904 [Rhipicephalus sanguineus]